MSQAQIFWQPAAVKGEQLSVSTPDRFIFEMQMAFPGEWPIKLTAKDIDKVEGMAAATPIIGNPYLKLVEHLKRYKHGITIWPEYGEDHGI